MQSVSPKFPFQHSKSDKGALGAPLSRWFRPEVSVTMQCEIESGGLRLAGYLARPESGAPLPGLVLCHGFPNGPGGAATSGQTYPQLAERLSADTGWAVLTFNFRGTGASEGNFSLAGWLDDLRAAVDHLAGSPGISGVWVAGAGTGGSLALCEAGEDERVRGVATLSARADFDDWASAPARFLDHARSIGLIDDAAFPADFGAWARELHEIRPTSLIAKIPPRPVLLAHGADDDDVPLDDARVLADAAGDAVELRVLSEAGHRLRHDPRAVALLLGWMERQAGS